MARSESVFGVIIVFFLIVIIGILSYFLFFQKPLDDEKVFQKIKVSYEVGDYPLCIDLVTHMIVDYPESKYLNTAITYGANLLYMKKDYDGARKYVEKVVTAKNVTAAEFVDAVIVLGKILREVEKYDPVTVDYLEDAYLKADKGTKPELAAYLGYAYLYKRDYTNAIKFFKNTVGEDAILGPAAVFIAEGIYSDALQEYDNYFNYYAAGKNYDQIVERYLKQCFYYARTLKDAKMSERALTYFYKVVNKFPGNSYADRALYEIADIYYTGKSFANSLYIIDKILANSNPECDPAALFLEGQIYYETGKKAESYKAFQEVRDHYPETAYGKRAIEWIEVISKEFQYN
ncbi:MAG: tetratricopeptide repeat protein [Brevinematales bacterium]|nr:tetratricopeptide repeat protein [Brevinematales bacterium]